MKYGFKNNEVNNILEFFNNVQEAQGGAQDLSELLEINDYVNCLLAGYTIDVLETAEELNKELNLDYETLNNFSKVMIVLWAKRAKEFAPEINRALFAKSVAAYLTLLAINEHDYGIYVSIEEGLGTDEISDRWADIFEISFGGRERSIDLLPVCNASIRENQNVFPEGVMLEMQYIREAYASISGVDLGEYGLMSIAIGQPEKPFSSYDKIMMEDNTELMMDILDEFFENAGQPAVYAQGLESKDPEKVRAMFKLWFKDNQEYLED